MVGLLACIAVAVSDLARIVAPSSWMILEAAAQVPFCIFRWAIQLKIRVGLIACLPAASGALTGPGVRWSEAGTGTGQTGTEL